MKNNIQELIELGGLVEIQIPLLIFIEVDDIEQDKLLPVFINEGTIIKLTEVDPSLNKAVGEIKFSIEVMGHTTIVGDREVSESLKEDLMNTDRIFITSGIDIENAIQVRIKENG